MSACFVRLLSSSASGTITIDLQQSQAHVSQHFLPSKGGLQAQTHCSDSCRATHETAMNIARLLRSSDLCGHSDCC